MRILLGLMLVIWAQVAVAQTPAHGLMWRDSPLPAVFPLQVKSAPGTRYYLSLTEQGSTRPALAAFIEGGRFFRVLVPPGTYAVALYRGSEWRGERALFGPKTVRIEVPPLTFATKGLRVKSGHLLDLTALDTLAQAGPLAFCQTLALVEEPAPPRLRDWERPVPPARVRVRQRLC
ncbi:hypothetical protein KDD17_00205 [Sulfitobacter albidus]|uniref:Uncharacterized protein n=1 Tax=Sulfitobacter albidus TaxID=2829501 RepID=A0A975PM90_9RHOB|nr:hypothetical protein [Sulfitobacter albidus]QUJ76548.1 hypothetical protein KDD17_00205 [Sulfitobacter albidus]